jgi:hypothetical protein
MYYISPQTLTVVSGILSAAAGLLWFYRQGMSNEGLSADLMHSTVE